MTNLGLRLDFLKAEPEGEAGHASLERSMSEAMQGKREASHTAKDNSLEKGQLGM